MEITKDELVRAIYSRLTEDQQFEFQERSAVIEFDGLLPRDHAECLGLLNVLNRHPLALTGVHGIWVELDGTTGILFTTDLGYARGHLAQIGGGELGPLDLNHTVTQARGGVLMLSVWREPER